MKKHFIVTLAAAAASFMLGAMPAAAQGRSAGHDAGAAAGMAGMHQPMGMDTAAGSHGASSNANTPASSGPKTADELLQNRTQLSNNLQNLLPTGMTTQEACANFTKLGPCVAAIHVAHNLKIDFASLECDMTLKPVPTSPTATCPAGTGTGTKGMSLGSSIQQVDPNLSSTEVKGAAKTANQQAHADLSKS